MSEVAVVSAARPRVGRVTVPQIAAHRAGPDTQPLVMVTAYDAPGAKAAHRAGVDMILVGDSLAMVVLGYDDTMQVSVADMAHHVAAVARGLKVSVAAGVDRPRPLIVGDLPWMSYHTGPHDAVRNAAELIRAGADCVKLEGGRKRIEVIRAIVDAEIPVMGHIGLTPQSSLAMGGFKIQGRQASQAEAILEDARALEAAGCFAVVVEGVPDALGQMITEAISMPTIGIGAGPNCDGQVLVFHDVLGIEDRVAPKFVRRYADLGTQTVAALEQFALDVRSGEFPAARESYAASAELRGALTDRGRAPEVVVAAAQDGVIVDPLLDALFNDGFLAGLYGGTTA